MLLLKSAVLVTLCAAITAAKPLDVSSTSSLISASDLWYLYRVFGKCATEELYPCIKMKLAVALQRLARNFPKLELFEGVAFVRDSENYSVRSRSINVKDSSVTSVLINGLRQFLDTHVLQINLSTPPQETSRSTREPRKKLFGKKGGGLGLLLAMGLGGALSGALQLSMMMGTVIMPVIIGIVAFKAVIVSVMGFVLAGVVGFRQMINEDKHEVVHIKAPHVDAGGWDKAQGSDGGRMQDSQSVVYSEYAHAPVLEHPNNVYQG